jgi:hypothetical protein
MTARRHPARGTDRSAPPGEGKSALVRLLEVQFWLMGRDVEHPGGNLLLRLGFIRQTVPDRPWPSRYRRAEAGGYAVIWRCGMFLQASGHGCLLLRGMAPTAVAGDQVDGLYDLAEVADVSRRGRSSPPSALIRAGRWFAHYEAEVAATAGVGHRMPRPGSTPALAPPEPCSLEREWREVAARLGRASSPEGPVA